MIRRYDEREARLRPVLRKFFHEQRDRIIDHLGGTKALEDEVFDMQLEVRIGHAAILPLIQQFLMEAGQDAKELLGSTTPFVLGSEIGRWLDDRAELFARSVNETTFTDLKRQFEESLIEGENRQQLIDRIQQTYAGYDEARATMIARTEVHSATQHGTFAGYQQAGSPIKIWVTVGDARVRHSHASVDGQEKPINTPFSNGLMYPGEMGAPASEVINCRCSL